MLINECRYYFKEPNGKITTKFSGDVTLILDIENINNDIVDNINKCVVKTITDIYPDLKLDGYEGSCELLKHNGNESICYECDILDGGASIKIYDVDQYNCSFSAYYKVANTEYFDNIYNFIKNANVGGETFKHHNIIYICDKLGIVNYSFIYWDGFPKSQFNKYDIETDNFYAIIEYINHILLSEEEK